MPPDPSITPMMKQYRHFKRQYPDAILFFRMGDFYEMFFEDAQTAARVLGLTLTSRDKGANPVPMAGVPHHSADGYIRRLIQAGHRVAVCEQMEDPRQAKGLVKRDVIRVITPGTLTEENLLEAKAPNYLAAVWPEGPLAGLAWLDLSTGAFFVEDAPADKALDELARLGPAECVVAQSAVDNGSALVRALRQETSAMLTPRPDWTFDREGAERELGEHFRVGTLAGFGCEGLGPAIAAAGAVLAYVQETQKTSLAHIRSLVPVREENYLLLDRCTRSSLELTRSLRDGGRGDTLLWVLDRTETPMGGRTLAEWIHAPLRDMDAIAARHDAVEELGADHVLRQRLREVLRRVYDIERLAARASTGRATPRDLLALKNSLDQVPPLRELLEGAQCRNVRALRDRLDPVEEARSEIAAALRPDPPVAVREGGIFRDGYSADLDELRSVQRDGKGWIARFQARELERTGIQNLKVGFNRVFGYYIEVSHAQAGRVPPEYVRKQTLKNAERYITPDLKEYETKVLTADERAKDLECEMFLQLREQVAGHTARLQATAGALAELDALASLADAASEYGYVRPELADEPVLCIRDGRHPVLERTLEEEFVPNDVDMDEGTRMLIITGPNMAGKSTFIRQAALLTIMAQMGSFVPAKEATIGLTDRIYTRVGAADELARGRSTFMVEMVETANILNNATPRSLLVLDEVGRGTSTFDGVSIAWAVGEFIHQHLRSRTLFATHYFELTELASLYEGIANCNVAVREWRDEIVFLRKIVPGGADKSYGLHVARLAGIPPNVVERAKEILANLEAMALDGEDKPRFAPPQRKRSERVQMRLFAEKADLVLDRVRRLDISAMTPLEALNLLEEFKKELGGD